MASNTYSVGYVYNLHLDTLEALLHDGTFSSNQIRIRSELKVENKISIWRTEAKARPCILLPSDENYFYCWTITSTNRVNYIELPHYIQMSIDPSRDSISYIDPRFNLVHKVQLSGNVDEYSGDMYLEALMRQLRKELHG